MSDLDARLKKALYINDVLTVDAYIESIKQVFKADGYMTGEEWYMQGKQQVLSNE